MPIAPQAHQGGGEDQRGGSLDESFPHPFTSDVFQRSLDEVPDGARLAIQTCLQRWRQKVRTTARSEYFC